MPVFLHRSLSAARVAVLLVLGLASAPSSTAAEAYLGRELAQTMSHMGAPWLTRGERMAEERPDLLWAALGLEDGDQACDIGSGNGYHTLPMAQAVAPGGRAFAVDIQVEMLQKLAARADAAGVENITYVHNTQAGVGLAPDTCDLALLVDVYHELSDPPGMLRSLRAALKPGGELLLVEYRAEDPAVPIKRLHKMSKEQVHKELTANGFKLVRQLDTLPWQHALFYQRADGPDPAVEPLPWTPQTPSPSSTPR